MMSLSGMGRLLWVALVSMSSLGPRGDGGSQPSGAAAPVRSTLPGTMQPTLGALEYKLTPRDGGAWWLEVVWRFQNPGDTPLHVLSKGRLSMLDGQPFVINHTASGHPVGLDENINPEMEFVVIAPHSSLDLRRTYPLPAIDLGTPRPVVGKFAVSYEAPDPKWIQGHVWDAVKKWQQVLQSPPFEIKLPVA